MLTSGIPRQRAGAGPAGAPGAARPDRGEPCSCRRPSGSTSRSRRPRVEQALANIAQRNQHERRPDAAVFWPERRQPRDPAGQVRAQIAWVKVVNRQIAPRRDGHASISSTWRSHEARRNEGQPEYLLSEIVLPVDNPAQAEGWPRMPRVWSRPCARAPASIRWRRQVSAAASAERGGDLGWVGASVDPGRAARPRWTACARATSPIRSPRRSAITSSGCAIAGSAARQRRHVRGRGRGQPGPDPVPGRRQRRHRGARAPRRPACAPGSTDCAAMVEAAAEFDAPDSGDLGWLRVGRPAAGSFGSAVLGPAGRRGQPAARGAAGHPPAHGLRPPRAARQWRRSASRSRERLEQRADRAARPPLSARPAQAGLRRGPPLSARAGVELATPLRAVIERFRLRADKRLGQHFLLDPQLLRADRPRRRRSERAHRARGRARPRRPDPGAARRRRRAGDRDRARPALHRGARASSPRAAGGRLEVIEADALSSISPGSAPDRSAWSPTCPTTSAPRCCSAGSTRSSGSSA